MKYNISLSQLEKIANPFEQISIPGMEFPIKLEDINSFLESGKNPVKVENIYSLLLDRTVNKILNFNQSENLLINLDKPINPESGWLVENVEQLAAMLFWKSHLNLDYVPANIEGNNELIKKLFKPESIEQSNDISLDSTGSIEKKHKVKLFDWKMIEATKTTKEEAKNAVLQEESINKILKLSTPTMWKDTEFVKQVFEKFTGNAESEDCLQDIPLNYLFSEVIINLAKENDTVFKTVWKKYKTEDEKFRKSVKNNQNKLEQLTIILKPLFEDEEFVKNIFISKNYHYINQFLEFIPDRFLLKRENVEISLGLINSSQMYKSDVLRLFPKRYFNKIENVFEFLNTCGHNGRTIANGYDRAYITKVILKDKETLLKALEHPSLLTDYMPTHILSSLYFCMNTDFKSDKDVVKKMIYLGWTEVLDNFYAKIEELNLETIETAFKKGYKGSNIPQERAFKMKDIDAQTAYLSTRPSAVVSKSFPIEWLENINNLKAAAPKLLWKKLPKTTQELILGDRKLIKILTTNNPNFYSELPLILKIDIEIAKDYAFGIIKNSSVDTDKYMRELPKSVWLNKEFSLSLASNNLKYVKNIPKDYLNDKDFVLQLFKNVGALKTNELLIELPKEICNFFNNHNITQKHTEFLEKAFFHHDLDNTVDVKTDLSSVKKKKI